MSEAADARQGRRRRLLRRVVLVLWIAMAGLCIVATALPLITADAWWIRAFDFPRLQILVIATITLALTPWATTAQRSRRGVAARWGTAAALLTCVVMQGVQVLPYTPLYRTQVEAAPDGDGEGIKLLVANVLMDNRDWGRVVQLVSEVDPDVVALVETDAGWRAGLSELTASYPYTVSIPQDNTYGILLYSRLPLRSSVVEFLFESDVPSIHTQVVLASGKSFDLHILHPRPPAPSEADDTTERDAELLLVGKQVAQRGRPAIVAGDLNDVAWSATTKLFQKTSGLLDPRVGRGLFSTFHAEHWLLRWPLDHVFHSEHFHLAELRRLEPIGSDHFPIFVHLVLDPDAPARQEEPKADSAEKQRADEKIAEPTRGGKE